MKRLKNYYVHLRNPSSQTQTPISMEHRRWFLPLAIGSIVSVVLLFLTTLTTSPIGSPLPSLSSISSSTLAFVESKFHPLPVSLLPPPPRFAYLISGASGDGDMIRRILLAIYHPRNQYVLHLDLASSPEERLGVENFINDHHVFKEFNNVRMITKANLVTYRGISMVVNTLHGAAILLKDGGEWDWFINLSASDYPLVTQDGEFSVYIAPFWSIKYFIIFSY